ATRTCTGGRFTNLNLNFALSGSLRWLSLSLIVRHLVRHAYRDAFHLRYCSQSLFWLCDSVAEFNDTDFAEQVAACQVGWLPGGPLHCHRRATPSVGASSGVSRIADPLSFAGVRRQRSDCRPM